MTRSRVPEQATVYNLVTAVMLLLPFSVCIGVAFVAYPALTNPQPQQVGEQPTLFVLATQTPTLAGPTPNATWTPSAIPSGTALPTATRTPTVTPTLTAT